MPKAGSHSSRFHLVATYVSLVCIVLHVTLHAAAGGLAQIARIVRPARLVIAPPPPDLAELLAQQLAKNAKAAARPTAGPSPPGNDASPRAVRPPQNSTRLNAHPLATALAVGLAVAGLGLGVERGTRETLHLQHIPREAAPVLDGEISDATWSKTSPVSVLTTQGGDFGGTHQSNVVVRAVHDGEFAYFAFIWDDPTRSLKHEPWVKRDGRWFLVKTIDGAGKPVDFYEDKFSVLLTPPALPLIGAAIHLGRQPLAGKPGGESGRGLHYTISGVIADVWQWRASHSGPKGYIEDCGFGGPAPSASAGEPYSGGFALDKGEQPPFSDNAEPEAGTGEIRPARLPVDLARLRGSMGRISSAPSESEEKSARWWMLQSQTEPYSPERDATIPDGTVIPGVVMLDNPDLPRDRVQGIARWAGGRWTLELARRLYTDDPADTPIKTGSMLWVAAFDHAELRHTRHLRPFTLEVD